MLQLRREHIVPCQWLTLGCCPHQTRTQWQKDVCPHPDTNRTLWSSVTHLSRGLPGCDTGDGRQVQNISSMKCRHVMLTCTRAHNTTHTFSHTRTHAHTHTHNLHFFLPFLVHAETNFLSSHYQVKRHGKQTSNSPAQPWTGRCRRPSAPWVPPDPGESIPILSPHWQSPAAQCQNSHQL